MKKMRLTWGMLALSVTLSFSACQKDEALAPEETEFASVEYKLPDLAGLEAPEVSLGSEAAPFASRPHEASKEKMEALSRALKQLKLDENQKVAVHGFIQQHQACIAEHVARIQQLHKELLLRANAAREDLLKAYKAGQITKAQLEEKLSKLRAALKEEMAKHDVKQMQLRILRKCRLELLQKIESILNQEQLRKWNNWKSHLG